ncbi:heavy metal translocating P-type ATPase [Patescibacteria group bacterium]|nr:heavy metal translocating P-type ATPase [Patescibacteria group bacterium]
MSTPKKIYVCPMHPDVVSEIPDTCPKCGMALAEKSKVYVCSMHPEIVRNSPDTCPKCGMALSERETSMSLHSDGMHANHNMESDAARDFLRRFAIVTVLLIPLVLLNKGVLSFLGIPDFPQRKFLQFAIASLIFFYALIFFEHAKHEMKARKYGMMTLVSLAVGAGYIFSAASTFIPQLNVEFYLEISTLIWILLFGHYLEARSSTAAGDALQEVAKLLPKKAHLKKGDDVVDVEISQLRESDMVLVKPGEKIPADGIVFLGSANTDEALISGESKPVAKKKGSLVVAGSICLDGSLTIKLSRVGGHSTIGQIEELIKKAQQTKPTVQKIADRAAGFLTISALLVAIFCLIFWTMVAGQPFVFAITLAITVLVIACPHALGLAIPTVSTIATSLATKNGVFLKDMGKLEVIRRIDYVVFDKTGTLTKGEFGVTDIFGLKKEQRGTILKIAASLEQNSSHVIGTAIVDFARRNKVNLLTPERFKNVAGHGITGEVLGKVYFLGNKDFMERKNVWGEEVESIYKKLSGESKTVIILADNKDVLGVLALSDVIKSQSYLTVERLHKMGIRVAMMTGDNKSVASSVAKKLHIDTFFAGVKPDDKYLHIKELQEKGSKIMMVGDGVNDAPALTQADVGVAVGAGTDVAVEAGDIVLTRSNPEDIAKLIVLSKKVYRKMQENLVWAAGYNIVTIPAAAGVFAPWGFFLRPEIGAILMAMSSVIVVINALLLKNANLE